MRRPFLVEEIMLSTASGQVRGDVWIDAHSATVEKIACCEFEFRSHSTDHCVTLNLHDRKTATDIVERTLDAASDLALGGKIVQLSANLHSPPSKTSRAELVLAQYLQTPREQSHADKHEERAKDESSLGNATFDRAAKSG